MPGGYGLGTDVWELCYLPDDFAHARNLTARHPDKLASGVYDLIAGSNDRTRRSSTGR